MICPILRMVIFIILFEASNSKDWKNRMSVFPEKCSGVCKDGLIMDLMVKPGNDCPDSISSQQKRALFVQLNSQICDSYVSCGEKMYRVLHMF